MRKKKYRTAAALLKAVNAYFDSVSHTEYVTHGDDKNPRRVRSDSGAYIIKREFLVPPSISALCLHIGISRQTWSEYSDPKKNPEFAEVCEMAKLIIEVYLEEQLLSRRKGVQGIMFNLKNNFGWSERTDSSVNEGEYTGEELLEGMSFDEKIALIEEAVGLFTTPQSANADSSPDKGSPNVKAAQSANAENEPWFVAPTDKGSLTTETAMKADSMDDI